MNNRFDGNKGRRSFGGGNRSGGGFRRGKRDKKR